MIDSKELNINTASKEYLQVEQDINHAISSMGEMSHIEYESTMRRKTTQHRWKKWLHKLFKLQL